MEKNNDGPHERNHFFVSVWRVISVTVRHRHDLRYTKYIILNRGHRYVFGVLITAQTPTADYNWRDGI